MKKIILSAAVVAAALCGVFTANQVNNEVAMNDLEMENVEVLAEGEDVHTIVNAYGIQLNCVTMVGTCFSYTSSNMYLSVPGHNK